jgi:DNA-binding response OmpR family regulator
MKILVVEDDNHISNVLVEELTKMGHDVSLCSTAMAAIRSMRQSSFDCMITDLCFPKREGDLVGRNGDMVTAAAKEEGIERVFLFSSEPKMSKYPLEFEQIFSKDKLVDLIGFFEGGAVKA